MLVLGLLLFAMSISVLPNNKILVSDFNANLNLSLESELTSSLYQIESYKDNFVYVSDVIYPENDFHALAIEVEKEVPNKTSVEVYIRNYMQDGWDAWTLLSEDQDVSTQEGVSYFLYPTKLSSAYQYKLILKTEDLSITPKVDSISVSAIDARDKEIEGGFFENMVSALNPYPDFDNLDIIDRASWGADESLMVYGDDEEIPEEEPSSDKQDFEDEYADELKTSKIITQDNDGNTYKWPIAYPESIKMIIVHHTAAGYEDLDSCSAAVNAIYYYHTVSRGWGDIGYNFLVCQNGDILEGRKGSLDALINNEPLPVGAHASGFNNGSAGIAMILNAEDSDPTLEALQSLMSLNQTIIDKYDIDLDTEAQMRGKSLERISGHRDVGSTSCPGQHLYPLLADIRGLVFDEVEYSGQSINTNQSSYAFDEVSDRETFAIDPQQSGNLTVKFKNTGTSVWTNKTTLLVKRDLDAEDKISFANNIVNEPLPTFAMQESQVKPGETATFQIQVKSSISGGFVNFEAMLNFNNAEKSSRQVFLPFYVNKVDLGYKIVESKISKKTFSPNEKYYINLKLKNIGNVIWNNDEKSKLSISGGKVLSDINSKAVKPGETLDVKIEASAPSQIGESSNEVLLSIGESKSLTGEQISFVVNVIDNINPISLVSAPSKFYFSPSETYRLEFKFKNNTNQTLVNLKDKSKFNFRIIKKNTIEVNKVSILKKKINPSDEFTVSVLLKAPAIDGDFAIYLSPQIGQERLNKDFIKYRFNVKESKEIIYKEENIRIHLSKLNVDNPILTSDKSFNLYLGDKKYASFEAGESIEISKQANVLNIKPNNSEAFETNEPVRMIPDDGSIFTVTNFVNKPAWDTTGLLNDNSYRGLLEARIYNDELTMINELPLESYIKGLGEVSNSDPVEKIKTIMVAARTYALYYVLIDSKFPGAPYHLSDDPEVSQKYLGYGLEKRSPNVVSAVDQTKGEIVTYDAVLVKTPYFNSTDGTGTKSAYDVWGWTSTPYLVSVPDSLCKSTAFNGHGVGVSGCGATEAAKQNKTYKEILKYYYTGIEIEKVY